MQALIRELSKNIRAVLLFAVAGAMISCSTPKEDQRLVDDPSDKKEGTVPWNRPEKWESGGNLSGMTDRR